MNPPIDNPNTPVDTTINPVDSMITCMDFISEAVIFEIANNCGELVDFCINIPFEDIDDFAVTIDGIPFDGDFAPCDAGVNVQVGVGGFNFLFENKETGCKDSVVLAVTCMTAARSEIITIEEGEIGTFCPDADELIGDIQSISNVCPNSSGTFADIELDSLDFCINYEGILTGEEELCLVLCDDMGICDTTFLTIRIIPRPLLLPIANRDIDTTQEGTALTIDVLANDSIFGELRNMEILQNPSNGEVTINPDNSLTYVPNEGYCNVTQPDLFMYGICNDDGCDTTVVEVWIPCTTLSIMNGFSPNEDGINDFFTIRGVQAFPDNELQILNRWGSVVFEQKSYKNRWNGTFQDKVLPDGTYFYLLKDGKGMTYSGFVQITR